jgi:hypothetical protein
MIIDLFLYILMGSVTVGLAFWSAILAIKSLPPEEPKLRHIVAFIVLGGVSVILIVIIGARNYLEQERADVRHDRETANLQATIQSNEIKNSGDLQYLKGRLDQALSNPNRPVPDLSALGAEITKNTDRLIANEQKKLSDKQLANEAISLAQQMRSFEGQQEAAERPIFNESFPAGASSDQIRQFNLQLSARISDFYQQESEQFRREFLSRAVILRDELQERLREKGKAFVSQDPTRSLAFSGVLAGPNPITNAADYLTYLATLLQQ